ncbi:protein ATP6V1FNB [Protobothrops mucrosquamatus]|uniref:protein ATP6V1FNB n=1 Tax=Protobothrops mucrosquamatus TaxID=103944 RepID=UPI000775DCAF|nr:protein ATP6V1FNB [Protobothrops mucrosquamatus]
MARPLNMDTLQQNFWKEEYQKEIMLRFAWHQKYGALVKAKQESLRERRRKAEDTTLRLPSIRPPPPVKPSSPPPPLPPPPPKPVQLLARERDLTGLDRALLEMEMKPAPREVRNLLYQGISHEDEGRYRYLKMRLLVAPEEKYTFPITTNFTYGWQMGKMAAFHVAPTAKTRTDSFFRKNGAFSLLHPRDVAL